MHTDWVNDIVLCEQGTYGNATNYEIDEIALNLFFTHTPNSCFSFIR